MTAEPVLSPTPPVAEGGGVEGLYREMVRIRSVEDAVHRLFLEGHIPGTMHLYQGEAVAVGVCRALAPGDALAATYRGHGVCLALGMPPEARRLLGERVACGQRGV